MQIMKKKIIICASLAMALSAALSGIATLNASAASLNADGWELREDGYYYEVNPPVTDLFGYEQPATDSPACHMYVLDYTGSMESGNFSASKREQLGLHNGTISTSQAIYAQYDSWGVDYFRQGSENNQHLEDYRHMDFTFMVDFTNLDGGYIKYRNHSTLISIDLTGNQIIVEEKQASNLTNYQTWSNMHTEFIPFDGLNDLTGWQQVTILIEDRVESSKSEITRNNNKGAQVTVTIGENSITDTIEKMGYYFGVYGIENHTNTDLPLKSTEDYFQVSFDTDDGDVIASVSKKEGTVLGALPTPNKGAYNFLGWYTTEDFQKGTECSETMEVTSDMTLYAKWLKPSDINADGWVLCDDYYYHAAHLNYKDIFDIQKDNGTAVYQWYQLETEGTFGAQGFQVLSRQNFNEESNVLQKGKMIFSQSNESIDYLLTNSTWVSIYPSQFVDFDFAFEIDFSPITSGTLKYVNDNIYITLDFSNDMIIIENREAVMSYEDWSWPNPIEKYELPFEGLSALTGRKEVRLMIDERVKTTRDEMTRDGNSGAVVTVSIDGKTVTQALGKLGYYAGGLGFINNTNADINFYTVKTKLIKEQITGYLSEDDYSINTWATISAYVQEAVSAVDSMQRKELDNYYKTVAANLLKYPTANDEALKAKAESDALTNIANNYKQADYDADNWNSLQALISEYTAKFVAATYADEVEELYAEFIQKANPYFTIADTQEKEALIAELNAYGNESDYSKADWAEICDIKKEYIEYINKAPSVWDVRQLVNAAKADIDSFKQPRPEVDSSSNNVGDTSSDRDGCFGSIGGMDIVGCVTLAGMIFGFKKRKNDE